MHPEVEEYFKIEEEARAARDAGTGKGLAAYEEEYNKDRDPTRRHRLYQARNAEVQTHDLICERTIDLAWAQLGLSEDKVVRFIARNCGSYRNESEPYALVILKMLPASVTDIRKAAREGNWCDVFDRFLSQAIAAGVIADNRSSEYRNMESWISANWGQRYVPTIMPMVDSVVAAEAERFMAEKNGAPTMQDVAKQAAQNTESETKDSAQPVADDHAAEPAF